MIDEAIDRDFSKQLNGYGLTTAEILYRMPDYPTLLQSYVWQDYDIHPKFPALKNFLDFWSDNLDGPLFRIKVGHRQLVGPAEFSYKDRSFSIN